MTATAWVCPKCKHFEQHPSCVTTVEHRCPSGCLTPLVEWTTREDFDAFETVDA